MQSREFLGFFEKIQEVTFREVNSVAKIAGDICLEMGYGRNAAERTEDARKLSGTGTGEVGGLNSII